MRTALFICTGNTCRSPMAEAIARDAIDRGLLAVGDLFVASAGTHAGEGAPVAHEALVTLRTMGIEHRGASKRLTPEMIRRADLVLAMSDAHAVAARALVAGEPANLVKVQRLDPQGDLEDPIGLGQEAYDAIARRLQTVVPTRLRELLAAEGESDRRRGSARDHSPHDRGLRKD